LAQTDVVKSLISAMIREKRGIKNRRKRHAHGQSYAENAPMAEAGKFVLLAA